MGYAEQQAVDREAPVRLGITLHDLMIRAAGAVVSACGAFIRDGYGTVVVLAGPGNNGGDAYATARMLFERKVDVRIVEGLPERDRSPLADVERERALTAGVPVISGTADWPSGALVVDGLFGTGFKIGRPIDGALAELLRHMRELHGTRSAILSIDIPSGVEADTGRMIDLAVRADATLTFTRPKNGMVLFPGRMCAGRIQVDSLGIPEQMTDDILSVFPPAPAVLDSQAIRALCPVRPADGHKGLFGKVMLTGGSPGMSGAVALAVRAALRSGAGLVYAMVPSTSRYGIEAGHPEAQVRTFEPYPPDGGTVEKQIESMRSVAAGPGLAPDAAASAMLEVLIGNPAPLVLDAGALACIADTPDVFFPRLRKRYEAGLPPAILTPHVGEYRKLSPDTDPADRLPAARTLADKSGCVVVLKGAGTVVAYPDGRTAINTTGNDGMAKGGSGDVLCGLVAGLLAQGMTPWDSACAGVCLHGLAGDAAASAKGRRAMTAGDLPAYFTEAFRQAGWEQGEWI